MANPGTQILETFAADLRRNIRTVQSSLQTPTLGGLNRTVQLLSQAVDRVNRLAGVGEPEASAVKEGVLYAADLPLLYLREGRIDDAAQLLAGSWYALVGQEPKRKPFTVSIRPLAAAPEAREAIRMYTMAVTSWVIETSRHDRAGDQIHLLMTSLRLSFDEMGRMLEVSGETVRRWASRVSRVPEDKLARLDSFADALRRLHRLFRAERLPEVVRRQAEVFEGRRAVDLILQGRLSDVVERYEHELAYQS